MNLLLGRGIATGGAWSMTNFVVLGSSFRDGKVLPGRKFLNRHSGEAAVAMDEGGSGDPAPLG